MAPPPGVPPTHGIVACANSMFRTPLNHTQWTTWKWAPARSDNSDAAAPRAFDYAAFWRDVAMRIDGLALSAAARNATAVDTALRLRHEVLALTR